MKNELPYEILGTPEYPQPTFNAPHNVYRALMQRRSDNHDLQAIRELILEVQQKSPTIFMPVLREVIETHFPQHTDLMNQILVIA